jgi:hypothetical protein
MVRKRVFVAPFILTSALAACGGSSANTPPQCCVNPPPPDQQPAPDTKNPPEQALPDAPTDAQGKVEKRDDGTCWFVYAAPTCPPNTMCNPPPAKQVKCE